MNSSVRLIVVAQILNPRVKQILIGGIIGTVIGVALMYVAALAAFGDSENSAIARVMFPYALAADPTLLDAPLVVLVLSVVQYPLYWMGVATAFSALRHRAILVMVCIAFIVGAHIAAIHLANDAYFAWRETLVKWE